MYELLALVLLLASIVIGRKALGYRTDLYSARQRITDNEKTIDILQKRISGPPNTDSKENIKQIDLSFTPEAAVSEAILLQSEYSTFLSFSAVRESKPDGIAVIHFKGCSITKFGYPNDEAWSHIPRTKNIGSYGIYEVENSAWKRELTRLNQYGFPDTTEWGGKHYLILFHDSSFECIARDIAVEFTEEPHKDVLSKLLAKLKW